MEGGHRGQRDPMRGEGRGWCGDSCGPCFEHALIEQALRSFR